MSDTITRVVHLRKEPYDVYIGRAGRGEQGYFGNPIQINHLCPECNRIHRDNSSIVKCYSVYFSRRFKKDSEFRQKVKALKGKRLGCFCKPKACHGDVLAFVANGMSEDK